MLALGCCWAMATLAGLFVDVEASPAKKFEKRQEGCSEVVVREEWRYLSPAAQQAYIAAVQCMLTSPPRGRVPGARSRYDDFVATHIIQANEVHFVGAFYPYHRLLVASFELALRVECGYNGPQPYWDWMLDVNDLFSSPIFHPVSGFGGNGDYIPGNIEHPWHGLPLTSPIDFPDRTGGGCIPDGPFEGLMTNLGPEGNVQVNPHCIRRDFCPETFAYLADMVWEALDAPTYGAFERASEPTCHAAGHYGIGGIYGAMTDKWASPVDPLFWLHHANVDRVWWSWQVRDPANRMSDISGPLVGLDWQNEWAGNLTLSHPCVLIVTGHGMDVGDTLDITRGPLCYGYDFVY